MAEKDRLPLTREQRAAMIGRDGNMQVRQRLQPGSRAIWRLGVKCTTLYMHSTGTAAVGIFSLVRLCLPALVFCCPFLPRACPKHCVGPGKTPAGCPEFYNVTRPDRLPQNWSRLRKVTEQMVPMLPGLVGAPLCNSCYFTMFMKGTATKISKELPAAGDWHKPKFLYL